MISIFAIIVAESLNRQQRLLLKRITYLSFELSQRDQICSHGRHCKTFKSLRILSQPFQVCTETFMILYFEWQLEHFLKLSLKRLSYLISYAVSQAIIQTTLYMYPFYYPFAPPFCYPHFSPYGYEMNNINQIHNIAQEIHQQAQQKNEQIITNYSVNDIKLQQKEVTKPPINPPKQKDFSNAKETVLKTQHKFQKPEQLLIKYNQPHISKDQTQRLRYVNKNYESNIINKIFAFLWSQDKSKIYVNQILKDKTKILLYFDYIKVIRKYCKRYINKEYLQNLCNFQPQHIAYRIVARNTEKLKYFSMKELSLTIRKLIYIYLKDVCAISILTSKKMRNDIWRDHLSKSRNIFQFLFQGLSPEEYDQRMSKNYNQTCPKYGEAQKE